VEQPDIVQQLRDFDAKNFAPSIIREAADEIEHLRQEVEQWRNAWEAECLEHEATKKAFELKP
jgi:HAMP domain-containing protein